MSNGMFCSVMWHRLKYLPCFLVHYSLKSISLSLFQWVIQTFHHFLITEKILKSPMQSSLFLLNRIHSHYPYSFFCLFVSFFILFFIFFLMFVLLERASKNILFKLFGTSAPQDPCTLNNDFFLFHFFFFLFLKQDCVRFPLLSCEVVGWYSILQIKNLRARDKDLSKDMWGVSVGIKITVQLSGLFFIVLCRTWKLQCVKTFPWRVSKVLKSQG